MKIARFINNISLNDKEYILEGSEDDSPIKEFDTVEDAVSFLNNANEPKLNWTRDEWEEDGIYIED